MTEKERTDHLNKMDELVQELRAHAKELLCLALDDMKFSEQVPGTYEIVEGDVLQKWERISLCGIWTDVCNLDDAINHHLRSLK